MTRKRAVILEQDRDKRLQWAAALKGPELGLVMLDNENDLFAELDKAAADLYVLRAEMDKASGYSICNRLRSSERATKAKVVLVVTQPEDPRFSTHKTSTQAADAYIAPPLGLRDLRLQAYSLLDLDGGTLSDEDIQAVEEDPMSRLDAVLNGTATNDSSDEPEPSEPQVERRRAEFSDEDISSAFGALQGEKPVEQPVEEAEAMAEEAEVVEAGDVIDVPEVSSAPSPLAQLSDDDLKFVQNAFQRVPQSGSAPPLPPPSKKKDLRGPDAKVAMLRDALREREQEIARLQEIWQRQEQAYRDSGQRVADMEVEVRAAQIEMVELKAKLKDREDEMKRVKREASASSDQMLEEKVLLEKDLIEVVAAKEKTVAELRRILSTRERDNEKLTADLQQKTNEHEQLKIDSAQAMSDLRTQTDNALELLRQRHVEERTALSEAADKAQAELSERLAQTEKDWFERHAKVEQARSALETELSDTKLVLESTEAERARLEDELRKKGQSLDDAYAQIANEAERLHGVTAERDALIEQVRGLKADVEARDGRIKTQEDDIAATRADKEGLAQRLGERLNQKDTVIEQLTKEVQVSREEREALLARLSERLNEREASIAEQKKLVSDLQLEKVQLETRVSEQQLRFDALTAERDRERQRLQSESELMSLKLVELQQQATEKVSAQMLEVEQLKQQLKASNAAAAPAPQAEVVAPAAAEPDVLGEVEKKLEQV